MYSHGGHEIMNKPDVFYRKVGENIRAKRKDRGLSQEGLAKAVGLKTVDEQHRERETKHFVAHILRYRRDAGFKSQRIAT